MMHTQNWWEGQPGDWTQLKEKATYLQRSQVLSMAMALGRGVPGHIIEFGSYDGTSARAIRTALLRDKLCLYRQQFGKRVYACDSFEGLPEEYEDLPAGTFAVKVPRLVGVKVVKGYFEDSLTPELAQEIKRVSLAHLDADLYSSTQTALKWLTPLLGPGSLLLFDEFGGEDAAECRAFQEWLQETGTQVAMIGLFGREPSSHANRADRRALFQVIGDERMLGAYDLLPTRIIRYLSRSW